MAGPNDHKAVPHGVVAPFAGSIYPLSKRELEFLVRSGSLQDQSVTLTSVNATRSQGAKSHFETSCEPKTPLRRRNLILYDVLICSRNESQERNPFR